LLTEADQREAKVRSGTEDGRKEKELSSGRMFHALFNQNKNNLSIY